MIHLDTPGNCCLTEITLTWVLSWLEKLQSKFYHPASTLSLALQGILVNYTQQILTEGNTNRMGCQYLEDATRMKDHFEKLKKLFEIHEII